MSFSQEKLRWAGSYLTGPQEQPNPKEVPSVQLPKAELMDGIAQAASQGVVSLYQEFGRANVTTGIAVFRAGVRVGNRRAQKPPVPPSEL